MISSRNVPVTRGKQGMAKFSWSLSFVRERLCLGWFGGSEVQAELPGKSVPLSVRIWPDCDSRPPSMSQIRSKIPRPRIRPLSGLSLRNAPDLQLLGHQDKAKHATLRPKSVRICPDCWASQPDLNLSEDNLPVQQIRSLSRFSDDTMGLKSDWIKC